MNSTTLKLVRKKYCHVTLSRQRRQLANAFPVRIEKNSLVGDLKKLLKQKNRMTLLVPIRTPCDKEEFEILPWLTGKECTHVIVEPPDCCFERGSLKSSGYETVMKLLPRETMLHVKLLTALTWLLHYGVRRRPENTILVTIMIFMNAPAVRIKGQSQVYRVHRNTLETIQRMAPRTRLRRTWHCLAEILVRLKNYGTLQPDSLEVMRNEYVVAILHTAINIATANNFRMRPECKIIGNENSGRVDYAIRETMTLFASREIR
ncbi:hypothetical protein GLOIN_2v1727104 [Rhizophagus irregularis DAOM 181602=DAOM 197198]|nr:hypothetical protein GLOIN_2v1727104 [Rhizophagus irregularis DAOM 181602=DAOM 197198]